ncbi:MAG: family protein phosphatase [Mycobacterium sp.]|nr:family protein phosphatase [Mycobacterium sp.]
MTTISVTAFTDTGLQRTRNEDAVLVGDWMCQAATGAVVTMEFSDQTPFVCAVADGMGGHVGGDLASRVALGVIADAAPAWSTPEDVTASLHQASERVYQVGHDPDLRGLGTTIAGVCVLQNTIVVFNIGDSRVYSSTSGFLQQISMDDAVTDKHGQPTNIITQSLGQAEAVTPHVTSAPRDGAAYLICSDGVSSVVTAAGLRAAALKPQARHFADAIIDATKAAGAHDNFSFAIVAVPAVEQSPELPPAQYDNAEKTSTASATDDAITVLEHETTPS